jgi:glutamyl-tRNA synthetase
LLPFLTRLEIAAADPDYLAKVVATLKTRSKTLVEMAEAARFYFQDPRPYEAKGAQKFLTPDTVPILKKAMEAIENLPELSEETLHGMLKSLADEFGVKMVAVAQPLRVALTGRTASPSLTDVIALLDKQESKRRITYALEFIEQGSKTT